MPSLGGGTRLLESNKGRPPWRERVRRAGGACRTPNGLCRPKSSHRSLFARLGQFILFRLIAETVESLSKASARVSVARGNSCWLALGQPTRICPFRRAHPQGVLLAASTPTGRNCARAARAPRPVDGRNCVSLRQPRLKSSHGSLSARLTRQHSIETAAISLLFTPLSKRSAVPT